MKPVAQFDFSKINKEKFLSKINAKESCWEWVGTIGNRGYGVFGADKKPRGAHRISFYIFKGYWPNNLVLHSCDNKICVNPDHLREGTVKENAEDAVSRGRCFISKDRNFCKMGHPRNKENTYEYFKNNRVRTYCKICNIESQRSYYSRKHVS